MPKGSKSAAISSKSSFEHAELRSQKYTSYFDVYDKVLKPYVGKSITLLEIGVLNGGGLMMWKHFLGKNARIIGVDLNPEAKQFEKFGFEICIGDQSDSAFWKTFLEKYGEIDIIIDDGGHTNVQQITSLVCLFPHVKSGGIYLIEDLHCSYLPSFGNPSRWSTMNFLISGVHSIHSRSALLQRRNNLFSSKALSISFFESIAVIEVLGRGNIEPKRIKNQGVKSVDRDFRLESLNPFFLGLGTEFEFEKNLRTKLKNKSRILLQRMILKIQNKAAKSLFKQSCV